MIYSAVAVGQRPDGTPYCTTCDADLDPETGKCADQQAIEHRIITLLAGALDRVIDQQRDQEALAASRQRRAARRGLDALR